MKCDAQRLPAAVADAVAVDAGCWLPPAAAAIAATVAATVAAAVPSTNAPTAAAASAAARVASVSTDATAAVNHGRPRSYAHGLLRTPRSCREGCAAKALPRRPCREGLAAKALT